VQILTGKLSGTYSPTGEGKFFFTMMAAFAELERDILHERILAGVAAARAQGRGLNVGNWLRYTSVDQLLAGSPSITLGAVGLSSGSPSGEETATWLAVTGPVLGGVVSGWLRAGSRAAPGPPSNDIVWVRA
jgi:hypothetical protein